MANNVNISWSVFEGYDPNNPQYTVEANGSTIAHIRPSTSNPNPKQVATLMATAPELIAKTMHEADDQEIKILAKAIFDGLKEDGAKFENFTPLDWIALSIRTTTNVIFKGGEA